MENNIKEVVWTTRAKRDLEKTMKFYSDLYGDEKAIEIGNNIYKKIEILETKETDLTKIGSIDTAFSHLKYEYRKLIEGYCKITYRIGKSNIYIVRVFEMRQNPKRNL